jgi:serine/threonine protein kinase
MLLTDLTSGVVISNRGVHRCCEQFALFSYCVNCTLLLFYALQGTLFAVKRMNMANQPNEIDNLLAEIQLMRGLSHPHIVEYLGAWVDTVEGRHCHGCMLAVE